MTNEMTTTAAEKEETKQNAIALAADVLQTSIDLNQIQADAESDIAFRAHYVDLETGDKGNKQLMIRILKEQQAVFSRHAEETDLRPVVVATALFASDILAIKNGKFGKNRYTLTTIQHDLVILRKLGKVAAFRLKPFEDKNRPVGPNGQRGPSRCKYYIPITPENANIALSTEGASVDIGTDSNA